MTNKMGRWLLVFMLLGAGGCSALGPFDSGQDSFERGMGFFNRGDYVAAIPLFREATRRNPEFAQAYFYLGRSYIGLSRWRSAIQPLRTAYRLAPGAVRGEIEELILDAVLAAALNERRLGDSSPGRPESSGENFREML